MKLKYIAIISITLLLLSAVPFWFYFHTFKGAISLLNGDWGTFGDFIGGVLNPVLTLFNLIAFLYFTYVIHEYDKNSKDRELNYQRKLIYSGEKYELFKKVNHSVNKISFILLRSMGKKADAITELFENCDSSFADIKLLFPEVGITDNETKDIQKKFLLLIKEVKYLEDQQLAEFTNAFGLSKEVIQIANSLLQKIKQSIETDLNTK